MFSPGDLVRLDSFDDVFPTAASPAPSRGRMVYPTGADDAAAGVAVGTLKIDDVDYTIVLHRSRVLITYPHRWRPL